MVKKLPYIPLYTGDWRKDPALSLCPPAARGVWIDLVCAMHDDNRSGELRGTLEQLAVLGRCSTREAADALTDLRNNRAAEVVQRGDVYIVRNRRMYRDAVRRKSKSEGKVRRKEDACTNSASELHYEYDIDYSFDQFWSLFPAGRKKSKGLARVAFEKALEKVSFDVLIEAVRQYAASDEGRGPYVKMPSTWLNQECWEDDLNAWRSKDDPSNAKGYRFNGE
jgi:hypothetical protein